MDRATASGASDQNWRHERSAAVAILIFAAILTVIRAQAGDRGPTDTWLGLVAFAAVFGTPGAVAAIGIPRVHPCVLFAAGIACVPLAGLSFTGITLFLLVPAFSLVFSGARRMAEARRSTAAVLPGVALVGLMVGATIVLLATTETVCWSDGNASGCDGGIFSVGGSLVALTLDASAVALTAVSARTRAGPPLPAVSVDRLP